MKTKNLFIIAIISIFLIQVQSKADPKVTFYGGISTPSSEMNKIYNSDKININKSSSFLNLFQTGIDMGYHFGVRVKAPLNDGLFFIASFEWNKFAQTELTLKNIKGDTSWTLGSKQNIIPISVGMQYYFIKEYIGIYALGMVNYNFFTSNATFLGIDTGFPDLDFQANKQSSRIGISAGAGVEFDLWLLRPMVEFRYNLANLIGKDSGELTKTYFTLSIGLSF